jgi:regulatory protein
LKAFLDTNDEEQLALAVGEKRWRQLHTESDHRKRRKKLLDFLVRRGFTFPVALEIVDRLSDSDKLSED